MTASRAESEPRHWTRQPERFGREPTIVWMYAQSGKTENISKMIANLRSVEPWPDGYRSAVTELSAIAAAQTQHRHAYALRRSANERYGSVKSWCEHARISPHQVWAVLRGEVTMRATDLGRAYLWMGPAFNEALAWFDASLVPGHGWLLGEEMSDSGPSVAAGDAPYG